MQGLIIADAGATKSDWALLIKGSDKVLRFTDIGINPLQISDNLFLETIKRVSDFFPADVTIKEIRFFGAGCIGDKSKEKVRNHFLKLWPNAETTVESDLLAAALALFGNSSGIAAILGTGSNSCVYSEGLILDKIPALGFILGDEGSGSALGKRLLNAVFKRELSPAVIEKFNSEYNLSLSTLLEKVYKEPKAGAFLASFSHFLATNLNHDEIYHLVRNELHEFFVRNICKYTEASVFSVGFIGSVAMEFKHIIIDICTQLKLTPGIFLRSPMEGLISYYK